MSEINDKLINANETAINDAWDDTLLIKAYDKSVKLSREELAKRIASSTSKISTERHDHNHASTSEMGALTSNSNSSTDAQYKVGEYARATYNEDGIDYEAKILSINANDNTCLIKFIGYDNEQEVLLSDLVPSWGKRYRRLQFAKAKIEEQTCNDTPKMFTAEKNPKKGNKAVMSNFTIPPPPPMPPMLTATHNAEDSEHLSAMLMSWYMSGYYTGIYQGMQMAKSSNKSKK